MRRPSDRQKIGLLNLELANARGRRSIATAAFNIDAFFECFEPAEQSALRRPASPDCAETRPVAARAAVVRLPLAPRPPLVPPPLALVSIRVPRAAALTESAPLFPGSPMPRHSLPLCS